MPSSNAIVKLAPVVFVFLWATGYVGAKYGTADAEPFTFLTVRFLFTISILFAIILLFVRPKNIDLRQAGHSALIGCLIQSVYLGGVFYAIDRGLPAGVSALIVALQPFFTALFAWPIIGERLTRVQSLCFPFALFGVFLVLFPDFTILDSLSGVTLETAGACVIATIGISLGAVYQKRVVTSLNLWVATAAQFMGAAVFTAILAFFYEEGRIVWSASTVFSLLWLVLVLSIGAVALLMYLIRRGDASSVASLFFLVPVVVLFMSSILFDERLVSVQLLGSAIVVTCVAVASRR